MHTCFRTTLASHHKPAIPAYQGRGLRAPLRAENGTVPTIALTSCVTGGPAIGMATKESSACLNTAPSQCHETTARRDADRPPGRDILDGCPRSVRLDPWAGGQ